MYLLCIVTKQKEISGRRVVDTKIYHHRYSSLLLYGHYSKFIPDCKI